MPHATAGLFAAECPVSRWSSASTNRNGMMAAVPKIALAQPTGRPRLCILCAVLAAAACLMFGSGCASTPPKPLPHGLVSAAPDAVDLSNAEQVYQILARQLQDWQGVRYRIGGLSKKGVDCSGFVYLTYLFQFGIHIPRSTELQVNAGYHVPLENIRAGDLVFFKTGFKSRHVGIYAGNKRFVHASKSRGVILSRLDDTYWEKRYWKSIRIELFSLQ